MTARQATGRGVKNLLTIPHLEALVAIDEFGSFRAASERLNVTQPTISIRIKELEQSLRVTIFDRSSYRPQLTDNGRKILELARKTLELTREMHALGSRRSRIEGRIRLAACDTFAIACLPALLNLLDERAPGIEVALDIDYSANLDCRLRAGQIDIGFLTSPTPAKEIQLERVADIALGWVANHHLGLGSSDCRPEDIAEVTIITNPEPSHLHETTLEWFRRQNMKPARLATCNSLLHIERLASAGVGAAILPVAILEPQIRSGALSIIRNLPPVEPHPLYIALKSRSSSPAALLVEKLAREVLNASMLSAR
jgi:DNA-binding transcriptional LysR family regulator